MDRWPITSVEASPGTLTVDAGVTLTIAPSASVLLSGARVLRNDGTTTWTSGDVNLAKTNLDGPRTTFLNNGRFSIAHTTTDARFFRETGELLLKPRFVNLEEGTLERLATSVGYTEIAVGTENDGVVRIDAGALYLGALFNVPLTDSGDYIAAAGTRLQLSGPRTILGCRCAARDHRPRRRGVR